MFCRNIAPQRPRAGPILRGRQGRATGVAVL
jgi:hypothetical protein